MTRPEKLYRMLAPNDVYRWHYWKAVKGKVCMALHRPGFPTLSTKPGKMDDVIDEAWGLHESLKLK